MSFTDSPTDDLSTGFLQMKELYPDINDQFDQFIVRWLDNGKGQTILKSEKIIRLANGFPTTEREAAEWDEKAKTNKEKMEAYVRKLVEEKLPKLKQSGPQTLRRRLSSSGGGWNKQNKGKGNKETKKEAKSEQNQQVNDNKEEQKIEQKSEDKKHEDKKHEDKNPTEQTVEDKNLQTNVKAVEKDNSHKEPEKKPEEEKKESSHKEPEKKLEEEEKKDSSHKEPEKKPEEEKKDKPYVLHAQWG